jgi:DNA-binding CsgD family transcriptional regulator
MHILLNKKPIQSKAQSLTSSEIEVIKHISKGMSNSEISKTLSISINTVKFHLKNIYKKLKVHSRIGAINAMKNINKSNYS